MKKAIVIDDSRTIADSLCELLSLLGIQAKAAYGAVAALAFLSDHDPDIVFVDIHMPGMDGLEVISFLRREPKLFHVPIVVITSDDQSTTHQAALKAGAVEVIVKPVTVEALEKVINSFQ